MLQNRVKICAVPIRDGFTSILTCPAYPFGTRLPPTQNLKAPDRLWQQPDALHGSVGPRFGYWWEQPKGV